MKIFGYVRDKNGNFRNRKEKVIEFSKLMGFPIDKMICEQSSENYEDMTEVKNLLETERDFILLVSDTSDLFEDDYSRIMLLKFLEEKNVFLIDSYYPNLDYRKLIDRNCKNCPSDFLTNMIITTLEIYLRKKNTDSADGVSYSDMRMRLNEWKRNV